MSVNSRAGITSHRGLCVATALLAGFALFEFGTRGNHESRNPENGDLNDKEFGPGLREGNEREDNGTAASVSHVDEDQPSLAQINYSNERQSVADLAPPNNATLDSQTISRDPTGLYGFIRDSLGQKVVGEEIKLLFPDGEEVILESDFQGFFCLDRGMPGLVQIEIPSVNSLRTELASFSTDDFYPTTVLKELPAIDVCVDSTGISDQINNMYLNEVGPQNLGTDWPGTSGAGSVRQTFSYSLEPGVLKGFTFILCTPNRVSTPLTVTVMQDGVPIKDAQVQIETAGNINVGNFFSYKGISNPLGVVEFNVKSGFHYNMVVERDLGRSIKLLPNALPISQFSIPLGETQRININCDIWPGRLSGQVVDQFGEPFVNSLVILSPHYCHTDNNGYFTFLGVSPDFEYQLKVGGGDDVTMDHAGLQFPLTRTLTGTGPADLGEIVLTRPFVWTVTFDARKFVKEENPIPPDATEIQPFVLRVRYEANGQMVEVSNGGLTYDFPWVSPTELADKREFEFILTYGHSGGEVVKKESITFVPSVEPGQREIIDIFRR